VKRWSIVAMMALVMFGTHAAVVAGGSDDRDDRSFRARLTAPEEVPFVSSAARGTFNATVSADGMSLTYDIRFSGLEGFVTQSHIHIGQRRINGGIALWLCQTARNPTPATIAAVTPFCNTNPDATEGMVSGVLTAANVVGPTGQAIPAGAFAEVIAAIRDGVAYANVHSLSAPGGEVRGQIRVKD
jgi:CHRD domain